MSDPGPDPLEEVEFLARSANRIEVLSVLSGSAYTRRELGEAVDASQPTLGRILRDLGERNWVAYDGERYRATATGRLVEAGITDLRDRLEAESRLREVAEWLPDDALDVDLRRLRDATVTTPTATRPNAPIRRMLELLGETDRAYLLSHAFNEGKLDLVGERTADGTLTTRGVFSGPAIEAVEADPALRERLAEILAGEGAEIRVTSESVPLAVEVTDERTHLLLRDADGIVRASVDTDDPTVREWALSLHERYWEAATPLDASDLED